MKLIAFGHRARSGKDTCAEYLRVRHGAVQERFANPLKRSVQAICGWDERHTDGALKFDVDPFWGFTPRWMMQRLGTEVGRSIDPQLWIRSMQKRLQSEIGLVVISDMRFPNEGDAVKAMGGITVKLVRPSLGPLVMPTFWNRMKDEWGAFLWNRKRTIDHPSETSMEKYPYDYTIMNDGSLEGLYEKVEIVLRLSEGLSQGPSRGVLVA